jgi:hypothetical protein
MALAFSLAILLSFALYTLSERVYKAKLNKIARENASAMFKMDEEVKHLVSTAVVLVKPWRKGRGGFVEPMMWLCKEKVGDCTV